MSDTSLVFNLVARDRASAALGAMKDKMATAAAGISAAVVGALGKGVTDSLDMGAASAKMAAQLNLGPAQAAQMAKVSASVYADAWGESTEEINESIRGVVQNIDGIGGAEGIRKATVHAQALAKTFGSDVAMSTAAAGQLIRTGLAKDADEAFDIITAGMQSAANKSDDFLETLNEYSTQWRRIGLDGQTATGLLSQGLKAGARDADQVADALGQFGERALAGGAPVDDAFKSIGLNSKKMAKLIGAGGDQAKQALQLTMDHLRGTKSEQVKLNAAAALFGDPGNVLGKALFALDPASAAASAGMSNVAGAADRMAATVNGGPSASLERFKREFTLKLAEVGGKLVSFGMDHKDYVQPLIVGLGVLAGTILLVQGATMAWSAAQSVWRGIQLASTAAQWLWNAAMTANPIGLIIVGVAALVAGFILLYRNSETFRAICTAAFAGVAAAAKWVWSWISDNWRLLLVIITGPIGMATGLVIRYWDQIKGGAQAVWNFMGTAAKGIGHVFSGIGTVIAAPFKAGFNAVAWAWNRTVGNIGFTVPDWVPGVGGRSFRIPRVPMLAKGGHITGAGTVIVGENGPEALSLGAGATVTPLTRGGAGGPMVLRIEFAGPREMRRLIRYITRIDGGGDVGAAFDFA